MDAISCAADAIREEVDIPLKETAGHIGMAHPKYEAASLVLGTHQFTEDIHLDGMRFGALKFSDHPRARVLRIDTQAAESVPGVLRVLTAADIPGARMVGLIREDWPLMIAEGEITRYIGDVIAGVVAETDRIAREAAELISVEYGVLEPITDVHSAMTKGTEFVHPGSDSNILSVSNLARGDVAAAETTSDYVSQMTFQTQRVEQGFMEPECAVAYPSDVGVKVFFSGSGCVRGSKADSQIIGLVGGESAGDFGR